MRRELISQIVQVVDYAWSESVWEHQLALPLLAWTLRDLLNSDALARSASDTPADDMPDLARLSVQAAGPTTPLDILFRSISFQLFTALAHLHALRLAHRDIKPENVMLDWDGLIVLVDFGTAWDSEGEDWGNEWKEDIDDMCCQVGTG